MADDKNRSFLNEYEKFRTLLRTVFFYGSFTIDDFLKLESLGIKKGQFQNYKIIAEDIIDKLSSHKEKRKDALKYDVEQFEMNYNYLSESFYIKTLGAFEANLTIAIMLLLSLSEGVTKTKLYDLLNGQEEKTVAARIDTMLDNGLIAYDNGRYRIVENPLNALSKKDFLRLLTFIDFQKNRIYPTCFGSFLFSSMLHLYEQLFHCTYESPFVMKSNHLGNILDDEIQWKLLTAISLRKTVSFQYEKPSGNNNEIHDIIPYRLLTEGQQNRVYLFGIRRKASGGKKRFYRLDKISHLSISGNIPENDSDSYIQGVYQSAMTELFSHVPVTNDKLGSTELLLAFDPCMRSELERQFSCITIDDQAHTAKIMVKANDNVLNPWLRAHADTVKILNDCPIKTAFDTEMQELKKRYGIIS